jgi:UDP-glucose 4-epimerase
VKPIFNPRDVLVARRAADVQRAKDVLGFEHSIAVNDGMRALIANS